MELSGIEEGSPGNPSSGTEVLHAADLLRLGLLHAEVTDAAQHRLDRLERHRERPVPQRHAAYGNVDMTPHVTLRTRPFDTIYAVRKGD